ncbi:hypothetical protein BCR44DRAFT_27857 [Catenaria anguillulae PL171]|uniref:Uncharacterized protein n=1 Tax=Catenaria anguillulae PL171 TaxID=765915 RepID=A0A1Y2HLL0_9FUNG|nr:hypothetical protein BCR44DRAFT_27857 [Catenaria anguillulae PL171]
MNYSAMDTTNTGIPPPPFKTTLPHTSTSPESGLSPPLPIEIVESILLYVPHRFPLRKIELSVFSNDSPAMHDQMHTDCISALNVVVLPPSAFQVFIPRLPIIACTTSLRTRSASAPNTNSDDDSHSGEESDLDPVAVPEWLSEVKHGYCLDLARENGHEHESSRFVNQYENVTILEDWNGLGRFIPVDETIAIFRASAQCRNSAMINWWKTACTTFDSL